MGRDKRWFNLILPVFSILFGIWLLISFLNGPSSPVAYEKLTRVSGQIDWVKPERYRVIFAFKGDDLAYNYTNKAGQQRKVGNALKTAGDQEVVVMADLTEPNYPWFTDVAHYDVYEVNVGETVVRTYDEVSEHWKFDESLMPYLAGMFILVGLYLTGCVWRYREKS